VEVASTGFDVPTIGRTFLTVNRAKWLEDEEALELDTCEPDWWDGPLPGGIAYTAHVLSSKHEAIDIIGDGEIVPWTEYRAKTSDIDAMAARGAVLRLRPGRAIVRFRLRSE
jgi:hypothetical protein